MGFCGSPYEFVNKTHCKCSMLVELFIEEGERRPWVGLQDWGVCITCNACSYRASAVNLELEVNNPNARVWVWD